MPKFRVHEAPFSTPDYLLFPPLCEKHTKRWARMSRSTTELSGIDSPQRIPAPASPPACRIFAEAAGTGRTFTDADDFEGNTAAIISHGFGDATSRWIRL